MQSKRITKLGVEWRLETRESRLLPFGSIACEQWQRRDIRQVPAGSVTRATQMSYFNAIFRELRESRLCEMSRCLGLDFSV